MLAGHGLHLDAASEAELNERRLEARETGGPEG